MGTTFVEFVPKILGWPKNVQISARFLTNFDFDREYLRNGSTYRKSDKTRSNTTPSTLGEKKFGELWFTKSQIKEIQWCILTHPNGFFSGNNISAFKGCCPFKCLHMLEIDPDYLAHPPPGRVVPQKRN